jgi:type I thyroxine 5'-deiodinase
LNSLYQKYGDRVAFLIVYILEAHPSDVWQTENNVKQNLVFASPRDEGERVSLAGTCINRLGIKLPAVIDDFSNVTERAYTGWPDRLYLIDSQDRVAYKSKPGPFGFKPAELEAAIQRVH